MRFQQIFCCFLIFTILATVIQCYRLEEYLEILKGRNRPDRNLNNVMPPSQLSSIEVEFSCGDTDVFVDIKPRDQIIRRPCTFKMGNPKNSPLKKTILSTLLCDFEFDAFEK